MNNKINATKKLGISQAQAVEKLSAVFYFFLSLSRFTALIWYNIGNNSRMVNGMFKPKRESQNEAEFVFIED
ncbi:hypothetical protein, partial [Metabacillus lacus]|uniref:hypothetical protein n=1 Tax=Metabacillus lacus TaxID=1983721 RepID=UPI001BA6AAD6